MIPFSSPDVEQQLTRANKVRLGRRHFMTAVARLNPQVLESLEAEVLPHFHDERRMQIQIKERMEQRQYYLWSSIFGLPRRVIERAWFAAGAFDLRSPPGERFRLKMEEFIDRIELAKAIVAYCAERLSATRAAAETFGVADLRSSADSLENTLKSELPVPSMLSVDEERRIRQWCKQFQLIANGANDWVGDIVLATLLQWRKEGPGRAWSFPQDSLRYDMTFTSDQIDEVARVIDILRGLRDVMEPSPSGSWHPHATARFQTQWWSPQKILAEVQREYELPTLTQDAVSKGYTRFAKDIGLKVRAPVYLRGRTLPV
jgi:hypothetical protein